LHGVKTKNDILQNSPMLTVLPTLGKPHVTAFPFSLSFAAMIDVQQAETLQIVTTSDISRIETM